MKKINIIEFIIFVAFIAIIGFIAFIGFPKLRERLERERLERERLERERLERENPILYPTRKRSEELYFQNIINKKFKTNAQVLKNIINPFSGYIICDYFLGSEVYDYNVEINLNNKINLNNISNYESIKNNIIIMCQVNKLNFFVNKIMPKLNCKIILITGQWHFPQVKKSSITDKIIKSNKIIRWYSQNPLYEYEKESKYYVFPYGICHHNCYDYYNYLISNKKVNKNKELSNLYCGVHKHLPINHIRKMYPIFSNLKRLKYSSFLKKISKSKYIISTSGDRDDCYRHYEAIGLNTIPISDIGFMYKRIFGDNMLYLNRNNLLEVTKVGKVNHLYKPINRDIITTEYWRDWVLHP